MLSSYVMGIGEAEAFSERLKRELQALEAANVHAILESEPLIDEVIFLLLLFFVCMWVGNRYLQENSSSFMVLVIIQNFDYHLIWLEIL